MSAANDAALIRIEHKLDALLTNERLRNPSFQIPPIAGLSSICPACNFFVRYTVDTSGTVSRACLCKTPVAVPLQLDPSATPTAPAPTAPAEAQEGT